MKWARRFLALLLAFVICSSLCATSLATNFASTTESCVKFSNEMVLEETDEHIISLRGDDLNNGDVRFSLLQNGEVIATSYVDRSASQIIHTEYRDGIALYQEVEIVEPTIHIAQVTPYATGFINVGRVGYDHYVQGMVMCTNYINWSYSTNTNPASVCDLNGYYRNIADFAATVCSLLSLIFTSGAMQIVNLVLTALGISGSVGAFLIPQYLVTCKKTEVVWRATVGSVEQFYQGYRCVVTHPDKQGQTVYDGDYYPTTAIANHNFTLALAPYKKFYPGSDTVEIVSWPI